MRRLRRRRPVLPLTAMVTYRSALSRFILAWKAAVTRELWPYLEFERTDAIRQAKRIPDVETRMRWVETVTTEHQAAKLSRVVSTVGKRAIKKASAETERMVGVGFRELSFNATESILVDWRQANLDLITSLQDRTVEELRGVLENAYEKGLRVETIREQIIERFNVSESHADLIARDQVLKLNSRITQEEQRHNGIERYEWSTSQDERVREDHQALNGQIFSWSDPPVVNTRTGETGHPGEDFQCRCIAIPIVD